MVEFKPGDLIFLTRNYNEYFHSKKRVSDIVLTNRLAKIEEIIDWNSDKGKKIKAARIESGKWADLSLEDCRYLISIYYPELKGRKGQLGVVERGVPMFQCNPKTGQAFFEKIPDWLFKEILKKCEAFEIVPGKDNK